MALRATPQDEAGGQDHDVEPYHAGPAEEDDDGDEDEEQKETGVRTRLL